MQVFIVTSKATEQNATGIILSVKTRLYGVFTSLEHAEAIAEKYDGTVKATYLDKEQDGFVLQTWTNPGFATG